MIETKDILEEYMKKVLRIVFVGVLVISSFNSCGSSAQKLAEENARIETQRKADEERQAKEAAEAQREAEEQAKKEAEEARKAKLVIVYSRYYTKTYWIWGNGFALENWESAFPDKAATEAWLKAILDRNDDAGDVLDARTTVYNRHVEVFKYLPNKLTLAKVVKAKQTIVEAYNRFNPILEDIAKITAKGVVFVEEGFAGFPVYDPTRTKGLFKYPVEIPNAAAINQIIDTVEREYEKLVDMYPVD
jgi:hypothetical protein